MFTLIDKWEDESNFNLKLNEDLFGKQLDLDNDTENLVIVTPQKRKSEKKKKRKRGAKTGESNDDTSLTPKRTCKNLKKDETVPTEQNQITREISLADKLSSKLSSSRFRFINQQMYSCDSKDLAKMFETDPQAFHVYHKGFLNQVKTWPVNPVDKIISWVKHRSPKLIIADMGCGNAILAQKVKNKVHSFDLVAINDLVTVADISQVPLESKSVDVVVFCLSLMGTNMSDFLLEANRILKMRGILKIAEITSRLKNKRKFLLGLSKFGFNNILKDESNTHFLLMDFCKTKEVTKHLDPKDMENIQLQPCLYKKR